jgi:signal transduction histidine kinase
LYNKTNGLDLETSSYVGFRIAMVTSSALPFLLFTSKERILMGISLLLTLSLIMGFDPIHSLFGVGYYDVGLRDKSYDLTNIRAFVNFFVVGSCGLILKTLFERSESSNQKLIVELGEKNEEIESQIQEITSQNENIISQKNLIEQQYAEILQREADLMERKRKLEEANRIIQSQQLLLHQENLDLEQKLLEQNLSLERSNEQLIQLNADLHQFTYMASHNLRGPIASLLGLYSIVPEQRLEPDLLDLFNKSRQSVNKLEEVVRDMNRVGLIGNNLLHIKEKIYWDEIVKDVVKQYENEIEQFDVELKMDFSEAPFIISIRTLLFEVLNNLINNSIKFRSAERHQIIHIKTRFDQNKILLEIKDYGLGIDLAQNGDKLFMMYKRFHNHVGGKGLGLFFVKEETEILGGTISVQSELNNYTAFKLEFSIA